LLAKLVFVQKFTIQRVLIAAWMGLPLILIS
jgi:hypothetical protein